MTTITRERTERADVQKVSRERRRASTLDGFQGSKLHPFARSALDTKNFAYRWFTDDGRGRTKIAYDGGWDFVLSSELGDQYDSTLFNIEADGRIRQHTNPGYSYLMKKPIDWYHEDMQEKLDRHRKNTGGLESLDTRGGSIGGRTYNR